MKLSKDRVSFKIRLAAFQAIGWAELENGLHTCAGSYKFSQYNPQIKGYAG